MLVCHACYAHYKLSEAENDFETIQVLIRFPLKRRISDNPDSGASLKSKRLEVWN